VSATFPHDCPDRSDRDDKSRRLDQVDFSEAQLTDFWFKTISPMKTYNSEQHA